MKERKYFRAGLDIGSTTAKIVLIDKEDAVIFSDYQRHHARVYETIQLFFNDIRNLTENSPIILNLTGSAALGVSQQLNLPFVQEMVATHAVVEKLWPSASTIMDIGGEDSKIIFLKKNRVPDIRMNGSCAGGTGSFIDQIATLLGITPFQLNDLASEHQNIYPIASRCGVFAKTDVQNMLSRNIAHSDIAASVFHAVAVQCINTLARGIKIKPKMVLCGGVFSFLPELVTAFLNILKFNGSDIILPDRPELMTAMGAAYSVPESLSGADIETISAEVEKQIDHPQVSKDRLPPLFNNPQEFENWQYSSKPVSLKKEALSNYKEKDIFLGIDSGSTTTKIVIIGKNAQVLFSWYRGNKGNPVDTVSEGLMEFRDQLASAGVDVCIRQAFVTGYGEDLVRAAFRMDKGIVETIAHYNAAGFIDPDVSFILDIGGQDMKAIFIDQGVISRIELNEACSSGCGSFLETLASSVNYNIEKFAWSACLASSPCDLGTRCTVFMNSKIKQSLRENASIGDISAGLSYSVIKNCLFKVLKLRKMSSIGDHIVLQGGAFKNPAIVRAMEILTEKKVSVSQNPELMGAFGAALAASDAGKKNPDTVSSFIGLEALTKTGQYKTKQLICKGCENSCIVTRFDFGKGNHYFSGNKCESYFSAKGANTRKGFNFVSYKYDLIFKRNPAPHRSPVSTIGIPRSLNFFENYPFWHALFTGCGINIILSSPSTNDISEKGMGSVMSDNICFPAKLTHGHIHDLIQKGAKKIFYPVVMYEKAEDERVMNTFNCPIVSSYADVIYSSINPEEQFGIPLDRPVISFADQVLLKKSCLRYLETLGVSKKTAKVSFEKALSAQREFKHQIDEKARQVIQKAENEGTLLIVLAGRPYHLDSLINHKIPEVLSGLGVDMITEDAASNLQERSDSIYVVNQWAYTNRIYKAAQWTAGKNNSVQFLQINSFGCGPDAIVLDEVKQILESAGKNHTVIRVDEIASPGSVRLRLRSLIESLKKSKERHQERRNRLPYLNFKEKDRKRKIWAPYFAEDYSDFLPAIFKNAGYDLEVLPKPDRTSVDLGLKYANNDICYPGTIVIGDIIKALKTRTYKRSDIAIGITQTGGQCRASNYLALIKKAMDDAGYGDIPIISVTASQGLVEQPGFKINWLKNLKLLYTGTMFADTLAKMYYSTVCREKEKGVSQKIRTYFMNKVKQPIINNDRFSIFRLLEKAIDAFNAVSVIKNDIPKMGIVGEIYAKYNYFANQNLVDWLVSKRIEAVMPPLIDYFIQDLVNYKENIKAGIRRRKALDIIGLPIEWFVLSSHKKINELFSRFRFFSPFEDIREVARDASQILSMTNQFGEGWLIPGEIASFAKQGVNHVISIQPFGCIANHIVSKGMEKRIRQLYPELNLYFLDFDPGMSEVNVRNRLHFMVEHL